MSAAATVYILLALKSGGCNPHFCTLKPFAFATYQTEALCEDARLVHPSGTAFCIPYDKNMEVRK